MLLSLNLPVSTRAEQSSDDMVVPQDAASFPDEEKSSVGETPGSKSTDIQLRICIINYIAQNCMNWDEVIVPVNLKI